MIPRKIHYCWFGGGELSSETREYILSWKHSCPSYEIIEWNESNFDVCENSYCREAYESGKWAFVSDYARLKILYEYGGIYLDTDVEVKQTFDPLLGDSVFCGFENNNEVTISTVGAEEKHEFLKELLDEYENRHFIKDGFMDTTTNLKIVTSLLVDRYQLKLNGKYQRLSDGIAIYPKEYFIAKSYKTGELQVTKDTFAIHHFDGSWVAEEDKKTIKLFREYWKKLSWLPSTFIRDKISMLIALGENRGLIYVLSYIVKKYK